MVPSMGYRRTKPNDVANEDKHILQEIVQPDALA